MEKIRIYLATHERKFPNEIVSKDPSLSLPLASHSTISKPNETIARTIKPPMAENKSERETKVNQTEILEINLFCIHLGKISEL